MIQHPIVNRLAELHLPLADVKEGALDMLAKHIYRFLIDTKVFQDEDEIEEFREEAFESGGDSPRAIEIRNDERFNMLNNLMDPIAAIWDVSTFEELEEVYKRVDQQTRDWSHDTEIVNTEMDRLKGETASLRIAEMQCSNVIDIKTRQKL